jgi:hypothetical protein
MQRGGQCETALALPFPPPDLPDPRAPAPWAPPLPPPPVSSW